MINFNIGRRINQFNSEGRNIAVIPGAQIETLGDGKVTITRKGRSNTYTLPDGCVGRSLFADPSRIIIDGYQFKDGVFEKVHQAHPALSGPGAIRLIDVSCPVCRYSYRQVALPADNSMDLYCHLCNHWFEAKTLAGGVQVTLLPEEDDDWEDDEEDEEEDDLW
ncbi:hypothetical protein SAMN04488112_11716 [Melghirimyces thermohalophilus]|uniref:Uncharacterized protein n=1 Tax=Melghirimyces thermohalophilus TaxID=1236220 RepID=A0A1G6PKK8_9BACL|nr:hypothetical protein [Melghirimyces thermohalophilus]SDC80598.1 hypothetical protein SAMN04488112_11716 [Melghirimyces thermohalophilus]